MLNVRQEPCAVCGRPAYIVHHDDMTGSERPLCRDYLPEGAQEQGDALREEWERTHPGVSRED